MRYADVKGSEQIEAQSENDRNADHEGLAVIHPCTADDLVAAMRYVPEMPRM
jgi:hypothetical protein